MAMFHQKGYPLYPSRGLRPIKFACFNLLGNLVQRASSIYEKGLDIAVFVVLNVGLWKALLGTERKDSMLYGGGIKEI